MGLEKITVFLIGLLIDYQVTIAMIREKLVR